MEVFGVCFAYFLKTSDAGAVTRSVFLTDQVEPVLVLENQLQPTVEIERLVK